MPVKSKSLNQIIKSQTRGLESLVTSLVWLGTDLVCSFWRAWFCLHVELYCIKTAVWKQMRNAYANSDREPHAQYSPQCTAVLHSLPPSRRSISRLMSRSSTSQGRSRCHSHSHRIVGRTDRQVIRYELFKCRVVTRLDCPDALRHHRSDLTVSTILESRWPVNRTAAHSEK